jgi:hypothetical protein
MGNPLPSPLNVQPAELTPLRDSIAVVMQGCEHRHIERICQAGQR